ncbi:MAG: hypothetical protein AB8F94_19950 [Saprospiraceae bacterium]
MGSTKPMISTDFTKNIEDAIKEYGTMACPNPRCYDKLVSKKRWEGEKKILEYHCQNSNCAYHSKRQILMEDTSKLVSASTNQLSYNKIFTFFGICLFAILTYTSYHLYSVNQYLAEELAENRSQRVTVDQVQATYPTNSDQSKVNRKPLLRSKGVPAKNSIKASKKLDINGLAEQTRTWIASGNYTQGKLNIQKLLENKKYQSALLLPENDLTRFQLIELVGDSYEKNGTQFSYNLLQKKSDFEVLQRFLTVFDVEQKFTDVYLGRAYLHLPNKLEKKVSLNERKKMQLTSLRYYLQAAKNNNFAGQKSSSIKAINELSKAYLIFKYNPKKSKKFKTIETLIKRNYTSEIQNRIDYVNRLIERI